MKNAIENDNGFFGANLAADQEESLKNNGHTVVSKVHNLVIGKFLRLRF